MTTYSSYSGQVAEWIDTYVSEGRKEASNNRPPSTAVEPDHNEAKLSAEASKWMGIEQHLFDSQASESSKTGTEVRQKAIELDHRIERMLSDTSIQASINADLEGERAKLVKATVDRLSRERDCRYFREENAIREVARYPQSRVMHVGIVIALALAETVMNAFFYENAQGLLGGFFVALGIAVVLMGSSFGLGFGFRFKNLKSPVNQATGWLCLVTFVILAVWANAVFAAFRAEYQLLTDPSEIAQLREAFKLATADAKNVFLLQLQFADLMSLILFGLGLLLSCLAFYKGYTFDDKYPGHGEKDRAVKRAQLEEEECFA